MRLLCVKNQTDPNLYETSRRSFPITIGRVYESMKQTDTPVNYWVVDDRGKTILVPDYLFEEISINALVRELDTFGIRHFVDGSEITINQAVDSVDKTTNSMTINGLVYMIPDGYTVKTRAPLTKEWI